MKKNIWMIIALFLFSCVEEFPEPDFEQLDNHPVTVTEKWTVPKPKTGLRLSFVKQTDEMIVALYTSREEMAVCTYDLKGNPLQTFDIESISPIEYEYPEDVVLHDDWIQIKGLSYSILTNIHTGVFHEHFIDISERDMDTSFNYILASENEIVYQQRRKDSTVWLMRWDLEDDVHTSISELYKYDRYSELDNYRIIETAYLSPLLMPNLKQVFVSRREYQRGAGVYEFTILGYPATLHREGEKWVLGSYYQARSRHPVHVSTDDKDFRENYSIIINGWDYQRAIDYESKQLLWDIDLESKPDSRIQRDDDVVFTKSDHLSARSIRNGKKLWSKSVGGAINQLGINDKYLAFISWDSPGELFINSNYLRILNKSNGVELYLNNNPLGSSNPVENELDAGLNRVVSLHGNVLYCADEANLMALEIGKAPVSK
jgi:hypothetical protein